MQTTISPAEGLPSLPEDMIAALNNVARWLALDDFTARRETLDIDAIVLAGNSMLTTIEGACRLAKERDVTLFISGGIGHSTALLATAVGQHPRYRAIPTEGRPEVAMLTDIAIGFWQLPERKVIGETASRNCGQNASFSRALL